MHACVCSGFVALLDNLFLNMYIERVLVRKEGHMYQGYMYYRMQVLLIQY